MERKQISVKVKKVVVDNIWSWVHEEQTTFKAMTEELLELGLLQKMQLLKKSKGEKKIEK